MTPVTHPRSPLVSIGVPVYNGQKHIERALDSLRNQTYENLQVLISDNASTDGTPQICQRVCNQDARFSYVRQPVNIGPTANFNALIDLARGSYFMWLGHDDWLSRPFVEGCVTKLAGHPDISLACGQAIYYQDGSESYRGVEVQLLQESAEERVVGYYSTVADNGTFYGLMRREQLASLKMINIMGGDWLLIAAIAFLGKVVTLPSISVNRELGGSTESYRKIALTLGLPKWQAAHPHLVLALGAFREIAWRDPVYLLGPVDRMRLAWKCQRILRLRHDVTLIAFLRRSLAFARSAVSKRIGGSTDMR